jgi:septal ring factor EnvC (AmiA/AmiB activator)
VTQINFSKKMFDKCIKNEMEEEMRKDLKEIRDECMELRQDVTECRTDIAVINQNMADHRQEMHNINTRHILPNFDRLHLLNLSMA